MAFDVASSPPVPDASESTRFYWDAIADHRLELLRCQSCGHFVHYPRPVCDRCLSDDLKPEEISGRGTLYSWCEVMQPSHPYFAERLPYLIGVIDIEEEAGVRIPTGIVDCRADELRCGAEMEAVFRQAAPGLTLVHFRPVGSAP